MSEPPDPIDHAFANLWQRNSLKYGDRTLVIACLIRADDWRPLVAPWWRGKEVCIIGADLEGNFFLRHCDGTVRYWEHRSQSDTVIAPSVRDFVARIQ